MELVASLAKCPTLNTWTLLMILPVANWILKLALKESNLKVSHNIHFSIKECLI